MTSPSAIVNSLSLGQTLLIETNRELLMGTLSYIDVKHLMLELDNAHDVKTNFTYHTPQMLAYQQMRSIKIVAEETVEENSSDITTESEESKIEETKLPCSKKSPKEQRDHSVSSKEPCDGFSIQLSALDFQLLQTQYDSLVFITQTDQKYHKAIADIRTQTMIGLLIDPWQCARHRKTSLIAISTPHNIYIFDIISLGKVFKELRLILESAERPRKAVHYSHRIVDHFKHRHGIELAGIFDTFVSYCLVSNEKTNKSLEEVVQQIFNISNVYFHMEGEENKSTSNPYGRPLCTEYRLKIAKLVAFQLKLYDHLLHEHMLRNFYKQCQKFSHTLAHNEDDYEVAQQLHAKSTIGHEHIQPDGNWKDLLKTNFEFKNNDTL
ncbi:protein Exd1 homolog [Musca autumnalis]|uniref:protein Exd1 homolog n=1 Tax=Musca autumnalis TaxID=221902 RepID=UPI003CF35EAE